MSDTLTVFRSADPSAQDDALQIMELLASAGIAATLADDATPGVPEGAWEVRVAPEKASEAEALIAGNPPDDVMKILNETHDLDLVTVYEGTGANSDMEALTIKSLLEANGIYAVLVSDSRLRPLPDAVRVAR